MRGFRSESISELPALAIVTVTEVGLAVEEIEAAHAARGGRKFEICRAIKVAGIELRLLVFGFREESRVGEVAAEVFGR